MARFRVFALNHRSKASPIRGIAPIAMSMTELTSMRATTIARQPEARRAPDHEEADPPAHQVTDDGHESDQGVDAETTPGARHRDAVVEQPGDGLDFGKPTRPIGVRATGVD